MSNRLRSVSTVVFFAGLLSACAGSVSADVAEPASNVDEASQALSRVTRFVYETAFSTDDFESESFVHSVRELAPYRGTYSIRTTYALGDIAGHAYQTRDEVETRCNDGANGNCQSTTYLASYTTASLNIDKALVSASGRVLSSASHAFVVTLRGRTAYDGAPPKLAATLELVNVEAVEGPAKVDSLVLRFGTYYLLDSRGGTTNNRLATRWLAQPQSSVANVRYDEIAHTIKSAGGVILNQQKVDDSVNLLLRKPVADDETNNFVMSPNPATFRTVFRTVFSEFGGVL